MLTALAKSIALIAFTFTAISAANAGQFDGKWSGKMYCSQRTTSPDKFPAFENQVTMTVIEKDVTMIRDTKRVTEMINGQIFNGNRISLSGEGSYKSEAGNPWKMKINGSFAVSSFSGSGNLLFANGSVARDCRVEMSLIEPATTKAQAQRSKKIDESVKAEKSLNPTTLSQQVTSPDKGKSARTQDSSANENDRQGRVQNSNTKLQAAIPSGTPMMRGYVICKDKFGQASGADPGGDGTNRRMAGESDFGPFEITNGIFHADTIFGMATVGNKDCSIHLAREFIHNAVPTSLNSPPIDRSALDKLRSDTITLWANASKSQSCGELIKKQSNALITASTHLNDNFAAYPTLGAWSATYYKRAQEIILENGCMSIAASKSYEEDTIRREREFKSIVAGEWNCNANIGGRDFWSGQRKWSFKARAAESYMRLPNGNTLMIITGRPNEKVLHLEPRMEIPPRSNSSRAFIDMLDADMIQLDGSKFSFRVTSQSSGYFPPPTGIVTCVR